MPSARHGCGGAFAASHMRVWILVVQRMLSHEGCDLSVQVYGFEWFDELASSTVLISTAPAKWRSMIAPLE